MLDHYNHSRKQLMELQEEHRENISFKSFWILYTEKCYCWCNHQIEFGSTSSRSTIMSLIPKAKSLQYKQLNFIKQCVKTTFCNLKASKQKEMLLSKSHSDQQSHQHTVRWGGFVSQDHSVLAFLPKPARWFTLAWDIHILVIHKHTAPFASLTWVAHWWEKK